MRTLRSQPTLHAYYATYVRSATECSLKWDTSFLHTLIATGTWRGVLTITGAEVKVTDAAKALFSKNDQNVRFVNMGPKGQEVLVMDLRTRVPDPNWSPERTKSMALELMDKHGLIALGWTFTLSYAKIRRSACTHFKDKRIEMTAQFAMVAPEPACRDTILHEIAHALHWIDFCKVHSSVPFDYHGEEWKRKAKQLGCSGIPKLF